jgi:50S ribosomal protein L16 3-hydroxylase
MLYLPPRVGHNGVGVGDGCMTWSIGFRAPSHSEILQGLTQSICDGLSSDLRYEDPDLALPTHPGEIDARAIARVQQIVQQYLNDSDRLTRWFGQSMTEPKYPELAGNDEPYTLEELREVLEQGAELKANEGSRFAFCKDDNAQSLTLFADGHAFRFFAPAAKDFAYKLCAREALFMQQDEALEAVVLQLLNQGSLYLDI